MRLTRLVAALGLVCGALGGRGVEAADPAGCSRWNIEVACSVSAPAILIGESFTATVVAKNTGDTALSNVTIRVRADQGAPCVAGPGASTSLLLDTLAPGDSKTLTAKFVAEGIGIARILGSGRDSLGWASGNCACTVDVAGMPAIQTEMSDKDASGAEQGIFKVGDEFLYVLVVQNDEGSHVTPDLKVVFTFPKELQLISGRSDGTATISGSEQSAESSPFALVPPSQKVVFELRVKAISAPVSTLVKVRAVVQTMAGVELGNEVESTTIR